MRDVANMLLLAFFTGMRRGEMFKLEVGDLGFHMKLIRIREPKGLDKQYFNKNGVIWLKSGSDKHRVNSKEELRRLFQTP